MARPLRIEFSGALYHVTSRGDGQEDIYRNDQDREVYLEVLAEVKKRYNWSIHAFCLMSNHYHLLVETPDANLAKGMRHLNGVYTQRYNRLHKRVGHVFQGRYKAILVQKENYLLELARYIVLNPVRARMARSAKDWSWSSYRATAGLTETCPWLTTDWILARFSRRKQAAMQQYRAFVSEGRNQPTPWDSLKKQIFLGDERFIDAMQQKIVSGQDLSEIPSSQKRPRAKPLSYYAGKYKDRDTAILKSYESGAYSLKEIGDYYQLHYSRVSRIIRAKSKT
ncbi:MAG: transposase [gamma proteobacterium symbiont of Bathyaustriella thionipta]|nr:transposase [gamma proteobacterium symbiont of Bathyaustriella thionipta]